MTPRILLSCSRSGADNYIAAVTACGGAPTALYCPPADTGYDGLILCGGGDVEPWRYGQADCGSMPGDPLRDAAELALIQAYMAAKKPILAICRGQQMINVALGGTLIQDLGDGLRPFHSHREGEDDRVHPVRAAPGSWFEAVYGPLFPVNSWHHQAVDAVAEGFQPVLWSEGGVIEAMEHHSLPILCVQFHPERMCLDRARPDTVDGSAVFHWFISQCKG